jgi:hypothetical protein
MIQVGATRKEEEEEEEATVKRCHQIRGNRRF